GGRPRRGMVRRGTSPMNDVTRILVAIEQGEPQAAEQLLPLVYHELRKLAVSRLAREKPGQTLQATALVHEVYLRLVHGDLVRGCAGGWRGALWPGCGTVAGISSRPRQRPGGASSSRLPAASGRRSVAA